MIDDGNFDDLRQLVGAGGLGVDEERLVRHVLPRTLDRCAAGLSSIH